MHSELIQREVLVHTRLAPVLPRVPADRVQLQQVLMNLLLNACDAMGERPREERQATVTTAWANGDAVMVSVADQGTGIPEGKLENVFEPFLTSKQHGPGLGLVIRPTIVARRGVQTRRVCHPER